MSAVNKSPFVSSQWRPILFYLENILFAEMNGQYLKAWLLI